MLRNIFRLRRLFSFSGRATRREYFLLLAVVWTIWIALVVLDDALFVHGPDDVMPPETGVFLLAYLAAFVVTFIVMLAALVRRVHDHNQPGVIVLLNIIPLVGWIFWLIQVFSPGNPYENDYGPDPRDPLPPDHGNLETVFS